MQTRLPLKSTLALALSSALFLAACSGDKKPEAPKEKQGLSVSTVTTAEAPWVQELALDAEVVSLASPDIAAEVSGKVSRVAVVSGQAVKKGDVLVTLDPTDLVYSSLESRAQALQAQAQLADKARMLTRNEELAAKEYIGKATLESSQAEVAALTQQAKAAQARAAQADSNLARARVVAPYDAVVAARNVAPGSYARVGDVLIKLWSPEASSLRVLVPQEYAGQVVEGQKLTLSWAGQQIFTTLARVRSDIDPASRSFEAQAVVPVELQAVTGAALSATLELSNTMAIAIPAQAVQLSGSSSTVFVVNAENKALKKVVTTGRQKGGLVEVLTGLSENENVIVEGAAFVQDGQAVLRKNATAEKAGA